VLKGLGVSTKSDRVGNALSGFCLHLCRRHKKTSDATSNENNFRADTDSERQSEVNSES
jgi:hypothetical protein